MCDMYENVSYERCMERVSRRVYEDIVRANRMLKVRFGNDPTRMSSVENRCVLRIAWANRCSVGEARYMRLHLSDVERSERRAAEHAHGRWMLGEL